MCFFCDYEYDLESSQWMVFDVCFVIFGISNLWLPETTDLLSTRIDSPYYPLVNHRFSTG